MITFCGSHTEVIFDVNGISGKEVFKNYEDGKYSKGKSQIITKHPNIATSVLIGKKGWGLWVKEWSMGIREGTFTKKEIFDEFEKRRIIIPENFLQEFYNKIYKT